MTSIPLSGYESVADAVTSIKTHREVMTSLKEHERTLDDVVSMLLQSALKAGKLVWSYCDFGYSDYSMNCARGVVIWSKKSEMPVMSFNIKSSIHGNVAFSSKSRAKLAGIACTLSMLFSKKPLDAKVIDDMQDESQHRVMLGCMLKRRATSVKDVSIMSSERLQSLAEIQRLLHMTQAKSVQRWTSAYDIITSR